MDEELKSHIGEYLGIRIGRCTPLSGGDISSAFLLETATERFFCKMHSGQDAFAMFQAEKEGLEAIARTDTIKTPQIVFCGDLKEVAFLLLEFITTKSPSPKDMWRLGEQLAALHKRKQDTFGWANSNFIGSLKQSNHRESEWSVFFVKERLLPQLQLAVDRKMLSEKEMPGLAHMIQVLENACNKVTASLLHGDLWNGNYLISEAGQPYLIDPAVYCGHNEVDLAMSRLFGGFSQQFYDAYETIFKPSPGAEVRQDLYQLYYLLVHLNLFGRSYYPSVVKLLHRYFPT